MARFFLFLGMFVSMVCALEPTKDLAVLVVSAMDFQGHPHQKKAVLFRGQNTQKEVQGTTQNDGSFEIHIPKGDTYDIMFISLSGPYKCGEIHVPLKAGKGSVSVEFDDTTVELRDVLFDLGRASLKSISYQELNRLVKGLKQNQNVQVEIAGHTDNQGGEEFNQELSQKRAETVMDYLVSQGIASARLRAVGYGFSQPVADNSTAEGRARNRRTEVRILNQN